MEYKGKLYGKFNGEYIELILTSEDVDRLIEHCEHCEQYQKEIKD